MRKLSLDLGIPQTFRGLKIPENALPQLANDAINDVCTGRNPRAIIEEDILELYKKSLLIDLFKEIIREVPI